MKLFKKILVSNRGEIAVRVINSAHNLGIKAAAIYSRADEDSKHVSIADEAYCIGDIELSETYLNIPLIIQTALKANCDAIHPGYGFLSENPEFVKSCFEAGITFIGPSAESMRIMGNKIRAREFAIKAGVPTTKGFTGSTDEILQNIDNIDFPVLVKAASGGGGKGMRIVNKADELKEALESTSREAASYFGDGSVYLEKYITEPRHIEIQVIGDHHGNVVHLYERECSIQRRYQKIIEESPSPTISQEVREQMGASAAMLTRQIGYYNAGTIEFLVDKSQNFYFLEMNTRIQVEHPVTEMVTGIDLVEEQILVAAGNKLSFTQDKITQTGHAIECRIYAEDPANNFRPAPGDMRLYIEPSGEGIRIDSGIEREATVQSFYDPMISKLIVWGKDREMARERIVQALKHYIIHGIETNIEYLTQLLQHQSFIDNNISTRFCDEHTGDLLEKISLSRAQKPLHIPLLAYLVYWLNKHLMNGAGSSGNVWKQMGYWRDLMELRIWYHDAAYDFIILYAHDGHYEIQLKGKTYKASLAEMEEGSIRLSIDDFSYPAFISEDGRGNAGVTFDGNFYHFKREDILFKEDVFNSMGEGSEGDAGNIVSPMPGKVIKINVKEGDDVKKGNVLLVVEAMKMENNIVAPINGKVDKLNVKEGDTIDGSIQLVHLIGEEKEIESE